MQFLSKIISSNGHRLFYGRATANNGLFAWYFVFIKPSKLVAFKAITEADVYDIADYGDVIKSGYGYVAPDAVIEQINKEYNCNFSN
jgi:hypothetical protein